MAMLRKLLKYDLRANIKIFLFVWPAIVVFAILERLAIQADLPSRLSSALISTTSVLYVLAVVAACVFALVISVMRFYSGLLRDEGYLMFTLPVRPWQLILSKFLTALLTLAVTIVLSVASTMFLFTGISGVIEKMYGFYLSMHEYFGTVSMVLYALMIFLALCTEILQIYLACAIGHLAKRKRILFSVLAYYGIKVALQVISVNVLIFSVSSRRILALFANMTAYTFSTVLFGGLCVIFAALSAVFFFVTEYILRNRLNLE
jgi:hypothetical protein